MKLISLIILLMSFESAWALKLRGGQVTHGSDLVKCVYYDTQVVTTHTLLDVYQKQRQGVDLSPLHGLDWEYIISMAKDELFLYLIDVVTFSDRLERIQNGIFLDVIDEDINDEGGYQIGKNCKLVQLASNFFVLDMVTVNKDYWFKLGNIDRAAFYLHETIYSMLIEKGEFNSQYVRLVVGDILESVAKRVQKGQEPFLNY